jgi:colanic acid biosynthesis protein WcaH
MLPKNIFQTVIMYAPLVSIDLCMVHDNKILLGLRSGEPLKNTWFTPGGRVTKNEPWQLCLKRIAQDELGYKVDDVGKFRLMGVWDHFYPNSFFDQNVSTQYVNLPHYLQLHEEPFFKNDYQHKALEWFDLKEVASGDSFHVYVRNYAKWLIDKEIYND